MKNINFQRTVEIRDNVDVFVAGGGPAGVASAVAAARNGAKVFLAEKSQCFGGMGTIAKVPAFMRFSDGVNFLAGGIGREIFDSVYGKDTPFETIEFSIDTEKLKRVYDRIVTESGVGFSFESDLIAVEGEEGRPRYAVIKGKEKLFAIEAKIFIDATGDGTVACWAGADSEKGDENGAMVPGTLCTQWANIDWSRAVVELGKDPDNMTLEDYFKQADFEDEIGRYCYPVDIHASAPDEVSKYPDIYENGYEKGKSYGIPFRSLLPKKTENIIVAGRCIGAEREMMGSVRVMPACYITGQAAGTAAAMSALSGTGLRELDIHDLQHKLVKEGAFLPNFQA